MKLLSGGTVLWEGELKPRHALLFSNRVLACLPEDLTEGIDAEKVILHGEYVSPGFIDVHLHGSKGRDIMDATDAAIDDMSLSLAKNGTTTFIPATVTASMEDLDAACQTVRRGLQRNLPGASLYGLHLEGPWIEKAMKGAHPEEFIRSDPDPDWVEARADVIRTVTFSPVLDPDYRFMHRLLALGIVPSIGHTTADFDTARAAIEAGAKSITHLFNAQMGLHHRKPGMVGAAAVTNVLCEYIADGQHSRPELFEPLCRLIGPERLILITDSIRCSGLPDGEYDFAGGRIKMVKGLPLQPDGTIAGSSLTLNRGVRNVWKTTGRALTEIVAMASHNPAKLHGLKRKGDLAPGMDADITCFDEDLNVSMTFVGGKRVA